MQSSTVEHYPAMLSDPAGASLQKMTNLPNPELRSDLTDEKMQLVENEMYMGLNDSLPPTSHSQNYTDYGQESTDKFENDSMEDQMMIEKNKSSRRKQSKPIRVQHSGLDQVDGTVNETEQEQQQKTPPSFDNDSSYMETDADADHSIACVICSEMIPAQQSMREHFMTAHANLMNHSGLPTDFPTEYHRLGHDIHPESDMKENYDNERRNDSGGSGGSAGSGDQQDSGVESGTPSMNIQSRDSGELHPGEISRDRNGTRIFHPDAYCELCDREFCNKYFLKTHKANKHGVYDSPIPMVSQPGPLPAPMFPMLFSQPGPLHMPPDSIPTSMSMGMSSMNSMIPPPSTEKRSPPLHMESPQQPPATANADGSLQAGQQKDLEDYCEICQKHFCNKYYLRKHKADVHGIMSEPHSKRMRSVTSDSLKHLNNMAASPVLLPQNIPNSMANVMLINPFAPLMAIPQMPNASLLSAHLPQLPQTSTPIKSPSNPQAMIGVQNDGHENNSTSPGAVSQEDLRRMGVLNTDTFCELCRKEFCNKYFLKIHKANKHGIYSYDDQFLMNGMNKSPTSMPPVNMSTSSTSPIVSSANSALDLKMNTKPEQPIKSENEMCSTPKPPKEEDSNQDREREKESDIINHNRGSPAAMCEICNKDFDSSQMLRIHHLTAHGNFHDEQKPQSLPSMDAEKPSTQIPQSLPTDQPSPIPGMMSDVPGMPTMFSSMIAAKLADRVMCDLCNKEVCNKYFLKTHKIKMHGIDPAVFKDSKSGEFPINNNNEMLPKPEQMSTPEKPKVIVENKPSEQQKENEQRFMQQQQQQHHHHQQQLQQQLQQLQKPLNQIPMMTESFPIKPENTTPMNPGTPVKPQRNEELLKMGIDPEAYCELCKKEFCSKYFLRTHMFNMHGIRVEGLKEKDIKKVHEKQIREMKEREMKILDLSRQPPPLPSHVPPPQHPLHPFTSFQMQMHEQFASRMRQEESNDSMDNKSTTSENSLGGKSREPANMIRVKCDICSKELCNKYFLRTHKLNKHGILDESLARESYSMFDFPKNLIDNWMNGRPTYMMDKYIKKDAYEGFPPEMKGKFGLGPGSPPDHIMNDNESSRIPSQSPSGPFDRQPTSPEGSVYSEVCHICHRRFKNSKWLKAHLYSEHNIKDEQYHDVTDGPFQACELCGMVFPDKSVLRVHLMQVHRVQLQPAISEMPKPLDLGKPSLSPRRPSSVPVTENRCENETTHGVAANHHLSLSLKRKYSKNLMRHKLHSCSHCDYKSRWLSNIYTHEERKHNIKTPQGKYTCNKCFKFFRYEHSLYRHEEECHSEKASAPNKSNALSPANPSKFNEKTRFRCAHCNERFVTRQNCQIHIRSVHKAKPVSARKHQCKECDYSTNLSKNLRNHMKVKHRENRDENLPINGDANANTTEVDENELPVSYATPCDLKTQSSFIMQPFTLKDDTNMKQFVTAVVYLPVKQKINEPINVTFELSPTEQ